MPFPLPEAGHHSVWLVPSYLSGFCFKRHPVELGLKGALIPLCGSFLSSRLETCLFLDL